VNLLERLTAEHSKSLTAAIVNYIGDDKKRFKELMDIFLKSEYRLTQRSAWPLSYVALEQPQLIKPYIGHLIKKLEGKDEHPAMARNILRIFQDMEIPEKYWGALVDLCFKFIMNETQPAAIRAFAITTASRICKRFPELKNELLILLKELNSYPQSAAIRQRIKLALKELKL
jgi:hypothetical protein